jgi:hypothetical protein
MLEFLDRVVIAYLSINSYPTATTPCYCDTFPTVRSIGHKNLRSGVSQARSRKVTDYRHRVDIEIAHYHRIFFQTPSLGDFIHTSPIGREGGQTQRANTPFTANGNAQLLTSPPMQPIGLVKPTVATSRNWRLTLVHNLSPNGIVGSGIAL